MKKIRIDGGPLAKYTGKLSGVPFEDGESQRVVTPKEARRIGINLRIVEVGTEIQAGTVLAQDLSDVPAPVLVPSDTTPDADAAPVEVPVAHEETVLAKKYTKEELEDIANEDGIKAVRNIANKFDVKGVQISQLISGILAAQGN